MLSLECGVLFHLPILHPISFHVSSLAHRVAFRPRAACEKERESEEGIAVQNLRRRSAMEKNTKYNVLPVVGTSCKHEPLCCARQFFEQRGLLLEKGSHQFSSLARDICVVDCVLWAVKVFKWRTLCSGSTLLGTGMLRGTSVHRERNRLQKSTPPSAPLEAFLGL